MNKKMIFSTIGRLLKVEAILMILPLIVSFIYQEDLRVKLSFIIPIVATFTIGILLEKLLKPERKTFYVKEGLVIVGLSWIMMSLFGCIPFMISKTIPHFIDAFFETVSGLTTTGASIVTNVEEWHNGYKSLLFWRSFTHWIGGMGILVFVLAILPKSDGQNIYILKAESTGPQVGKLVSKVQITARILYLIYFVMTLIEIAFLYFDPDMPIFDAILHSFATAGTGGFGIKADSVASYSIYSQVVISIFMFLFGINFNIFYLILIGKFKQAFKNEELLWYAGIVCISTVCIMLDIYFDAALAYESLSIALKDSFFQVSSIITTTGFATTDFTKWSNFSQTIILLLMFIGGCAGSTAGGMKVSRFVILFKSIKREIKKLIHPNSVVNVKFDGGTLEDDVAKGVSSYFTILIALFAVCLLAISFNGYDFLTSFSAVATCINNVGPGLGNVIGPMGSFAPLSYISKFVLTIAMLIGRLEIYPILILFNPKIWFNQKIKFKFKRKEHSI